MIYCLGIGVIVVMFHVIKQPVLTVNLLQI